MPSSNSRRAFLASLSSLWAEAQEMAHRNTSQTSRRDYAFRFFSDAEVKTMRRYLAVLLPPSRHSRGAAGAGVEQNIDFILSFGGIVLQEAWHAGLQRWSKEKDTRARLTGWSKNEFDPRTPDALFFVAFKHASVDAFYTSEEGIVRELGYQGLGYLKEFPGCTHETHPAPSAHTPLLKGEA